MQQLMQQNQLLQQRINLLEQGVVQEVAPVVAQQGVPLHNFNRAYSTHRIDAVDDIDIHHFLDIEKDNIVTILTNSLNVFTSFKLQATLCVEMSNITNSEVSKFYFHLDNPLLIRSLNDTAVTTLLEEKYNNRIDDFVARGSGWAFDSVVYLELKLTKYIGFHGSSYIPLPYKTRSVLNIQNDDNWCFLWCTIAALTPPVSSHDHAFSVHHYKQR